MEWIRARPFLEELVNLLTCAICKSYLKDPCTLDSCDHNFCRKCIVESLGSESKCPECGSFSWLKDIRLNHQLATIVNMMMTLQSFIGINMEVENAEPQVEDDSGLSETFNFASDEEMPWENYNEKIIPNQSQDEQQNSSSESGGNTKEFETNRKTDATIHADTKESDSEEHHVSSVDNTDNKQRNVRISTCTKHNKRLLPPSVTKSRTDTESRLTRATISEALNERTNVKENVINRREKITKHQSVTLQKHNEDTREDSDDLEQEDRTRRKPANIRRNKKMRKLPCEMVQSSAECDCDDDDDDLEQEDRTGRKPASIEKKKMRKSPSETVQSSAQSDSEQENLEQNRTGRKPVSIRRKRKLRKTQSNSAQSIVESDSEVDDDLEQENRTGRKPVSIRKKKMRKPQSETEQSSAQSDNEEDLEQDRTGRKPVSIRKKKMRKPQSETEQSSAQSDSEEDLEQDRTGRKPAFIKRKKSMGKPRGETVQSSGESDSEVEDDLDDISERKQASIRKKKIAKSPSATVQSSGECDSEADNMRTASANTRQRRNLRKSTAVGSNKKTNKQATDVPLSATELSESDAKHDSEIAENESPKRHCREDVRKLPSVKRKKKKTIQRSSSRRKVNANIVKSVTSTVATEEKSVKPRSSARKSTTVVENITTKQWPVWSSTGDSDSETNEEATNAKFTTHTRESAGANNKLQVNTETTSDSEENNVSTIEARFTNDDISIKHYLNMKKRWNLGEPDTDRKRTSLMLRPTFTKEETDTESMENEEEATKTGIVLEQNPTAHAVEQSKSSRKNSFEQESGAKAKQRKCSIVKSMTTKIMEDMTVEQTLKSSVQRHRDATECDPNGMQKSNRKTSFSKIDTGARPPAQRPSKRATQRRNCQNASQNIVGNKKYFLRHKLNPTSKLIDVPFDFTQQEDPFHFSGTSEKDNNHCTDESDHNNDGTDLDDMPDYNDIDNDDHRDNYDHHDNDDDGYDYDGDDHGQKISKSSTTTSVHARKSKGEKSKPRNTRSSKMRLANEMKEQFTKLKGRPTKNHQFENGNNNLNQSSIVVNDENIILDTKRRRARGKRYNIRQYLIAVDPTDTYEISSDDPPRKKSRNLSTSSFSQNSQNAIPFSQTSHNVAGLSQKSRNKKGETPLHLAAIKGDVVLAQKLISEGADPNVKDHAGWTPLHEACNHGHVEIVKLFLNNNALINIPGCDNDTPLHDAVANGRLSIVKLLVARGAILTARNKEGLLPMDYAVTKEMKTALNPLGKSSSTKSEEKIEILKSSFKLCRESQVILGTAIKTKNQVLLKKCVRQLGGTLVHEFAESVTHVVTSVNENGHCPRTMKYLCGILAGKWIVSFEWIKDSLRQRQWLDEGVYEVEGTVRKTCDAARKARLNILQQMPRLLDGCSFFLRGVFNPPTPSKQDLAKLIQLGGGKLLQREPKVGDEDLKSSPIVTSLSRAPEVAYHAPANSSLSYCTEFILFDPLSCDQHKVVNSPILQTAPVTWLMDCISSFQLLDIPDVQ